MSDKIVDTSKINDEKLGGLLQTLIDKHEDNMEAVAHELNLTVIRPAGERAAAFILRTNHKALYDMLPEGDVDAIQLLQIINTHLDNTAAAIQKLEGPENVFKKAAKKQ
jgi:hypothetical protein